MIAVIYVIRVLLNVFNFRFTVKVCPLKCSCPIRVILRNLHFCNSFQGQWGLVSSLDIQSYQSATKPERGKYNMVNIDECVSIVTPERGKYNMIIICEYVSVVTTKRG